MYTSYSSVKAAVSILAVLGGNYATTEIAAPEVVRARINPNHVAKARTTRRPTAVYLVESELISTSLTEETRKLPVPQTALGRKLLELRTNALAKGMQLLTTEEVNALVRDARGEA